MKRSDETKRRLPRWLAFLIAAFVAVGTITGVASPASANRPAFQMPFPCGEVWRASTYSGHDAIDWNAYPDDNGRPVVASAAGTASLEYQPNYGGYMVNIDHGGGWTTVYAHLKQNGRVSGQVTAGQVIGYVGSTGSSTAPHLHWEQKLNGTKQVPLYADGAALSPGMNADQTAPEYTSDNCEVSTPPSSWTGVGNAQFKGTDRLAKGQTLTSNQYILSGNGKYALLMQSDGNLVMYSGAGAVWHTNTAGSTGAYLIIQTDGNMVLYNQNNVPLWEIGMTTTHQLIMQGDGNLVAYNSVSFALWASGTASNDQAVSYKGTDRLSTGQKLVAGKFLRSPDRRYIALMQYDGNLVVYGPGYRVLWNSGTSGHPGAFLLLQPDGNIVIYNQNYVPLWQAGTSSVTTLIMQSDGNFVGYATGNQPVWNTGTSGKL